MANLRQFKHGPLVDPSRQIRLVYIPLANEPLKTGENLQFKLRTFDLTEMRHKFTAVSYAWGDQANLEMIYLNGRSFNISENLWWFLNHVRVREREAYMEGRFFEELKKISRWFWIDQISIDQSLGAERNHQVKLMSDIYASADRVLVWLGNPVDSWPEVAPPCADRYLGIPQSSTTLNLDLYVFESLQCRYWKRLWVIQEIMLGREVNVLFGSLAWRWSFVRDTILKSELAPQYPTIIRRKSVPSIMTDRFALHRALELFTDHECEDPRDKVYGLLGIVDKTERIEVDYRKSAADIYWDAIAAINARKLRDPARIIALGREMGVTGQEGVCSGTVLEKFQTLVDKRHSATVFRTGAVAYVTDLGLDLLGRGRQIHTIGITFRQSGARLEANFDYN